MTYRPVAGELQDSEARKAYLKGHHLIKRYIPGNAQRAIEYFYEAIRLDPDYVLPYHGAAIYYLLAALMGELPPQEALRTAEDFLDHARMIDDNSAMLQNTFAMLRMFQWRWDESEAAFHRAIELEPDNPHVRMMAPVNTYPGQEPALRLFSWADPNKVDFHEPQKHFFYPYFVPFRKSLN